MIRQLTSAAMSFHANCHKDTRTPQSRKGQAAVHGAPTQGRVFLAGAAILKDQLLPREKCEAQRGWQRSENSEAFKC